MEITQIFSHREFFDEMKNMRMAKSDGGLYPYELKVLQWAPYFMRTTTTKYLRDIDICPLERARKVHPGEAILDFDIMDAFVINRYIYEYILAYRGAELSNLLQGLRWALNEFFTVQTLPLRAILKRIHDILRPKDWITPMSSVEGVMQNVSPITEYNAVLVHPELIDTADDFGIMIRDDIKSHDDLVIFGCYYGINLIVSSDELHWFGGAAEIEKIYQNKEPMAQRLCEYYIKLYQISITGTTVNAMEAYINSKNDGSIWSQSTDSLLATIESAFGNEKPNMQVIMQANDELEQKIRDEKAEQARQEPVGKDFNYPIETLRSFITTSRRFRADQYLLSMFMSQYKDMNHRIMTINDFSFSELQDKYLVTIAQDMANGNVAKIIAIDRAGNIHVEDSITALT